MSDNKKYFEDFLQIWPKGAFAKPVMGERGQKNLPSGTEGGENLDLEIHYEHKQHTFDRFCKTTIKHEAFTAFRQIWNQQKLRFFLSKLTKTVRIQLADIHHAAHIFLSQIRRWEAERNATKKLQTIKNGLQR